MLTTGDLPELWLTETRQDHLAMGWAAITRREDTAAYAIKNSHMRWLRSFQHIPGRRLGENPAAFDRCLGESAPTGRA